MAIENFTHDIETQTTAFSWGLGGKKRVEYFRLYFRWNSPTAIGQIDLDAVFVTSHINAQGSSIIHRLQGIVNQIHPNLIEFVGIT